MDSGISKKQQRRLSMWLSQMLRHKATEWGYTMNEAGWVSVDQILEKDQRFTWDILQDIVAQDNKGRFKLEKFKEEWYIRANQGHSVQAIESEALLTRLKEAPGDAVVHATYWEHVPSIMQDGLDRRGRRHIHMIMAKDTKVMCRGSSEVFLRIDVGSAIKAGIPFYRSDNDVILCEGPIPPKYLGELSKTDTIGTS